MSVRFAIIVITIIISAFPARCQEKNDEIYIIKDLSLYQNGKKIRQPAIGEELVVLDVKSDQIKLKFSPDFWMDKTDGRLAVDQLEYLNNALSMFQFNKNSDFIKHEMHHLFSFANLLRSQGKIADACKAYQDFFEKGADPSWACKPSCKGCDASNWAKIRALFAGYYKHYLQKDYVAALRLANKIIDFFNLYSQNERLVQKSTYVYANHKILDCYIQLGYEDPIFAQKGLDLSERLISQKLPEWEPDELEDFRNRIFILSTLLGKRNWMLKMTENPILFDKKFQRIFFSRTHFVYGQYKESLGEILRLQDDFPNDPEIMNLSAWFYSICPDDDYRDSKKGYKLATNAIKEKMDYEIGTKFLDSQASKEFFKDAVRRKSSYKFFDTLAASLAANKDFKKAVFVQSAIVDRDGKQDDEMVSRLDVYKDGQPYVQLPKKAKD